MNETGNYSPSFSRTGVVSSDDARVQRKLVFSWPKDFDFACPPGCA